MHIGNVLHAARWKYRTQKSAKNVHLDTIAQLCPAISSQLRHVSTVGKKLVKQQLFHMSSQYGELWPTNGWDLFGSLGHSSKFQRVSRLAFVTTATSLSGGQPNFPRCAAISLAGTLYIHFGGLLTITEFCHLQNSLSVQVLRSAILAALPHGTRAAAVSQTWWPGTRNGITELSQRAPPIFGWAAITLVIGPHSSSVGFLLGSLFVTKLNDWVNVFSNIWMAESWMEVRF